MTPWWEGSGLDCAFTTWVEPGAELNGTSWRAAHRRGCASGVLWPSQFSHISKTDYWSIAVLISCNYKSMVISCTFLSVPLNLEQGWNSASVSPVHWGTLWACSRAVRRCCGCPDGHGGVQDLWQREMYFQVLHVLLSIHTVQVWQLRSRWFPPGGMLDTPFFSALVSWISSTPESANCQRQYRGWGRRTRQMGFGSKSACKQQQLFRLFCCLMALFPERVTYKLDGWNDIVLKMLNWNTN